MKQKYLILFFTTIIIIGFSKTSIIGIYNNPPLVYYENNKAEGFCVEILKEIAKKERFNLKYEYGKFIALYEKLKNGEIDILVDIAYSKERENFILFNQENVFTNWGNIYSYDKDLDSILKLKDKTVAVAEKDIYYVGEEGIKKLSEKFHLNIKFLELKTYEEVIKAVKNKIAYAGVISRAYNGEKYNLYKTNILFSPVDIKYGFRKNINADIINTIDMYLKKWKNDKNSVYYELIEKYFGNIKNKIPEWIFWILSLGIFILFITLVMLYIYRKSLINATKELKEKNESIEAANEELISLNEELEELYRKNEEFSNKFMKMTEVLSKMKASNSIDEFYKNILEVAINIISEADYGSIIIIDLENQKTKFVASYGHNLNKLKRITSIIGKIPDKEDIRVVNNVIYEEKNENFPENEFNLLLEAAFPIKETLIHEIALNKNLWARISLDISQKSEKHFSENSHRLIEGFGNLIKAFWSEKTLTREIKDAYLRFATKLSIIAEAHDDITGNHIYRVGKISKFIAEKLGLDEEKCIEIEKFSPLHDIGKIFIDRSLLRKPEKLSKEEYEKIKMHTIYAVKLLDDPYFELAKNIAVYHHENYDGSGYPFKLKNGEIPIEAQIVSLADIYDALRSERSYKEAFSHEKVYKIITEGDERVKPTHFHPKILEVFKKYHLEIKEIYDTMSNKISKEEYL
ncbi:HD domain-containing phosphohydrolase [Marinitoga arctica]